MSVFQVDENPSAIESDEYPTGDNSGCGSNGCSEFHKVLNEFREHSVLTDVTILADDGEALHAHSVILAAGSDSLKETLSLKQANRMLQRQGFTMKIDGISSSIWKLILDFLYVRRLSVQLSVSVVKELFVAARILGIKTLVSSLGSLIISMEADFDINSDLSPVCIKLTRKDSSKYVDQAVQVDLEDDGFAPLYVTATASDDAVTYQHNDDDLTYQHNDGDNSSEVSDGSDGNVSKAALKRKSSYDRPSPVKPTKRAKKKMFYCINPECGEGYTSYPKLRQHYFDCIMTESSYDITNYLEIDNLGNLTYSDPFQPPDDPHAMQESSATLMDDTTGLNKVYQCDHCEKKHKLNRMTQHLAHFHCKRKPNRCKLCDRSYKDYRAFTAHYMGDHNLTVFECAHCLKKFGRQDTLSRHILMEHKRNGVLKLKYICKFCGKKFRSVTHKSRHETSHQPVEERRNHPCSICGKKFVSVQDQRKHESIIHSEDKPFECSMCTFRSTRRGVLLHERTHGIITANYMCITCGRSYIKSHSFNVHIQETGHEGKHVNNLTPEEHETFTRLVKPERRDATFEYHVQQPEEHVITLNPGVSYEQYVLPVQNVTQMPKSEPLAQDEGDAAPMMVLQQVDYIESPTEGATQIEQVISQNIHDVLGSENAQAI